MIKSFFRFLTLLLIVSLSSGLYAQVTTSGIKGRILDQNKQPLPGATVVSVHLPSGTQYGTITNNDGYYQINGMRTGGPYKVDVTYIGYSGATFEGVQLTLGDDYPLNVTLTESSVSLSDVVVQAARTVERTGTNTNISSRQIQTMPTISRSINDFTRVSPYAGSSNSFAGRDGRFNNITIDGAAFNNNFGLSSKNLPGGDAQPISLDAIEEISVNVSPFDIRQSNFTGASINAVTKSGDNNLKVSAYTFMRPKSFTGEKVGDKTVANAREREANTYGISIGAPIIKNKLFFFVNGELEKEEYPGIEWRASTTDGSDASAQDKISRATTTDLEAMRNHLINTHNYDPGSYSNFGNFASKNHKIMARVDWNINNNHKFTVRFNDVKSTNDQSVNANSAPNERSSNRYSTDAMSFNNSNYNFTNYVRSITGEINSKFGSNISNKLLASYTHIQDTRGSDSDLFPFVDIYKDGKQYMNFGYELFTYNNDVENNTLNITNNVTINMGKHQLLAGVSFDRLYFMNSYLRYALGYYRYASMEDFMTNQQPTAYGLTYGYNGNEAPGAELTFGMGAVYVQDEYSINENLKITAGLRLERPFYFDDPDGNQAIKDLTFANNEKIDVSKWPDAKFVLLPRVGFNWDVNGDRSVIVRGGSGLFSGLLPFVWYTNQPTNSGVLQNTVELKGTGVPADLRFERDWRNQATKYPNLFPEEPAVKAPGSIAAVSQDFKLPRVWRSTLGVDYQLPYDMTFTAEFMYSKDLKAVIQENINEKAPTRSFKGADNRQSWVNLDAAAPGDFVTHKASESLRDNRLNSPISNAMVLKNTNKGYQYSLMAQLTKKFSHGISGMVAYTYSVAKDMTSNPGSSANSAWSSNVAVNSLNTPGLSYSNFQVPHRIVGSINYRVEYFNHLATSLSLLYTGSSQGRMSYTYSNDLNGDGNASDLMYIPKSKNELMFTDIVKSGVVQATAQEQQDAFWSYVESDKYLRDHKGEYAERFGKIRPWRNRFDFKIAQEIFTNLGASRKGVLTASLDILNVGNLINKDWGLNSYHGLSNYDNIRLLTVAGYQDGQPVYQLNASDVKSFKENARFVDNVSTSSTWGMLLGLKLSF